MVEYEHMSSESFPKPVRQELHSEAEANNALDEAANTVSSGPTGYSRPKLTVVETVASPNSISAPATEPVEYPGPEPTRVVEVKPTTEPIQTYRWEDGVEYTGAANDEIVITGVSDDTDSDKDLALTADERAHIQASLNMAKQTELVETATRKVGFFGRIKRWFVREKQDDRTLEQILSDENKA